MPVEYCGFHLVPVGFFDRNPALDVPPPTTAADAATAAPPPEAMGRPVGSRQATRGRDR